MNTALQTMPETRVTFSRDQVELLKTTICRGATDDEFKLFLEVCRNKGLDPFSKQIYAIKRYDSTLKRDVMSFQTGIDGFRSLGESTGKYAGQDEALWCGPDGIWKDVWLSEKPPSAAKVSIYRTDFAKPITRIALYREYVQTNREGGATSMWSKMPANQLAKCAEALAFRAAFPEKLSGLHTHDEMGQADNPPETGGGQKRRPAAALRRPPEPETPPVIEVTPIHGREAVTTRGDEPEPKTPVVTEETGAYRVPAEMELRNGLRKGLETIPAITKAWNDLAVDYARAGASEVLRDIQMRFERTREGNRTPLSLRTAVIVARNWKDDNIHLWLQPAEVQ
jgi:phage recombination protein Bet